MQHCCVGHLHNFLKRILAHCPLVGGVLWVAQRRTNPAVRGTEPPEWPLGGGQIRGPLLSNESPAPSTERMWPKSNLLLCEAW